MAEEHRVEGLKELDDGLKEFSKATARNILRRVLLKAAQPIATSAERTVIRRRGQLQRSIGAGTKLSPQQAKQFRSWIGSQPQVTVAGYRSAPQSAVYVHVGAGPLPHAHMVEFGSAHNVAHPFLRPAWDAERVNSLGSIKDDLAAEIEKARQRAARKALKQLSKIKG